MSKLFCEVIGCGERASFVRIAEGSGILEEYLCAFCHRQLLGRSADDAICYAPLQAFDSLVERCFWAEDALAGDTTDRAAPQLLPASPTTHPLRSHPGAEPPLQARNRQMAAIHAMCASLSSTLDLDQCLHRILTVCVQAIDGVAGSIYLYRPGDNTLVFAHVVGSKEHELTGQTIPAASGIAGAVFQSQEPQITHAPRQNPLHRPDIGEGIGLVTESLVTVPLNCKAGKPVGVLQVLNKQHGQFTAGDLEVLEIVASIAAMAIETRQLHQDLKLAAVARALGDLSHDIKNKVALIPLAMDTLNLMLEAMYTKIDQIAEHAPALLGAALRQTIEESRGFYPESSQIIRDEVQELFSYTEMIANAVKGIVSVPQLRLHKLEDMLERPMQALAPLALQAGVHLMGDFGAIEFYFDPFLVERAVYNLIHNAISATPEGGTVTVRTTACKEGTFPAGNFVLIEVNDTGQGMSALLLQRLLSGEATSTKLGGTGLGTRLIYNAVAAHQGRFEGTSQEGVGSTFGLRLPLLFEPSEQSDRSGSSPTRADD